MTELCRGRKIKNVDTIDTKYAESQSEPGRVTEKRDYNHERE